MRHYVRIRVAFRAGIWCKDCQRIFPSRKKTCPDCGNAEIVRGRVQVNLDTRAILDFIPSAK